MSLMIPMKQYLFLYIKTDKQTTPTPEKGKQKQDYLRKNNELQKVFSLSFFGS